MGVSGAEYGIAALGGAVEGFFDNQARENAEVKAQTQLERQAQLLMMKEARQRNWEMRKQKDQQAFDLTKQGNTQDFEMKKTEAEYGFKSTEAQAKRAQEIADTADKNEFEMKNLGVQHSNALDLETVKEGKKSTKDTQAARTELRKLFEKAKIDAKKDPFGDQNQPELKFDSWAQTTYPELVEQAYPDGLPGKTADPGTTGGSKFQSIFDKVTGAASRTKQGANDNADVEEPAPIMANPAGDALPMFNANKRSDPEMLRADGSEKGKGFLGQLPHASGKTSTEISIGVNIGGKETEIPALVPTLTKQEVQLLLSGGEPTKEIIQKAVDHAKKRMSQGKSVFANPNDGDY